MIESRKFSAMGGRAALVVHDGPTGLLDELIREAERLESLWSRFVPGSDLSRLNHADGAWVRVDPDTAGLINAMRAGWRETAGAFDPTMLPALLLAGYAASVGDPAQRTELPSGAHDLGDLDAIEIRDREVRLPPGMTLDSGGIGKGYAGDLLCARARERGASGVLVDLGGDLVVSGQAPDAEAWHIGVESPEGSDETDAGDGFVALIRLAEGAVATSGTRRRRWLVDGHEQHHLLDPRTLLPARTGLQSATVVAGSGARAEALTKAAFVPPPEGFLDWIPTRSAAALVVTTEGLIRTTSNWEVYR